MNSNKLNSEGDVYARLETIKSKLLERPGRLISGLSIPKEIRKAAVCLIIRPSPAENELYLFLVKRKIFETDPWSGQMALPGGKFVEKDTDLLGTVIREVLEETGIDLRACSIIGSLDEILPGNRSIRVMPYVAASPEQVSIKINDSEIQDYVWVPLSFFLNKKNLVPYSAVVRGTKLVVKGYTYLDKGTVWGMTARIIQDFASKITT